MTHRKRVLYLKPLKSTSRQKAGIMAEKESKVQSPKAGVTGRTLQASAGVSEALRSPRSLMSAVTTR